MPFVNVKVVKASASRAQKAEVVREITDMLQRVLGKRPDHTHIVIEEVEPENWGFAGMLTDEHLKQQSDASERNS